MTSENLPGHSTPGPRSLKIEESGGFAANNTKPKIRLMGRWLQQAGFTPGERVHIVCLGLRRHRTALATRGQLMPAKTNQ